jgi:hypothetical protein
MSETVQAIVESQAAPLSAETLRDKIDQLEALMRREPQVEIEPVHHFAHGLYAREITIRAGTLLTGKIHRTEHLNVISQGRIIVWTEDGMREVSAPFTMVSRPGTKRVGYALEDTVWTTIHATAETDLVKLEAELIAPTRAALDEKEEAPCLG